MPSPLPYSEIPTPPPWWTRVFQAVAILVGVILTWFFCSAILSIFPAWLVVLATVGLGIYVWYRTHSIQQRAWRIDAGLCADCGYDLRKTPDRCPECGRDTRQDEPVWRKLRREHARGFKPLAGRGPVPVIPLDDSPALPPKMMPSFRVPPPDLTPIPVEGEE